MKKILVTGANGQLGQCIQKIAPEFKNFQFIFKDSRALDITNKGTLQESFSIENLDYCINCAAYTNVEQAEKTPDIAYAVNAEGVKNLAEICKEHKTVLIHISTDYVFDGEKNEGYLPSDTPNPINEYGKSKLLGEKYLQEIMNNYWIIRTSWLYSEFGSNFYKTILEKSKTNTILKVTDVQKGCPTNANNLALYILENITNHEIKSGINHFTDNIACTWYDFAKKILTEHDLLNTVELVRDKKYRTFVKRPVNSVLI